MTPVLGQADPLAATSALAPYLAGPGAAVLALLLVLGGLYALAVKHFIPLAGAIGKRHLDQIDDLIKIQKAESNAITKTLASIDRRLARLEEYSDVGRIVAGGGPIPPDRLT